MGTLWRGRRRSAIQPMRASKPVAREPVVSANGMNSPANSGRGSRHWASRLVWAAVAALLAASSFAHATGRIGLNIPSFAVFGPSFHGWRAGHARLERALVNRPTDAAAERLTTYARSVVQTQPLALPAWRSIALADAARDRPQRAKAVMNASHRLSRRDPVVQAWLIDEAIRRAAIPDTLVHFDALLRTEPDARVPLLTRLTSVLAVPEARRDLARFVSADTPWFPEFSGVAVQQPGRIAPYAMLLRDALSVPDSPLLRQVYVGVVARLVREGDFAVLRQLYPRLPGAEPGAMTSLSLAQAGDPLYPPIGWTLADEPDRGASLIDSADGGAAGALEAYAEPLVTGVVARRLVYPVAAARTLSWRVVERDAARDATGSIRVRCLDAVVVSANFFDTAAPRSLTLPATCPVAMVEVQIYGGSGRDPATIVLDRIMLGEGAARAATRAPAPRAPTR